MFSIRTASTNLRHIEVGELRERSYRRRLDLNLGSSGFVGPQEHWLRGLIDFDTPRRAVRLGATFPCSN